MERDRPHLATAPDPISAIVYAARPTDVRTTVVDGHVLVDDFRLMGIDVTEVTRVAAREARALATRAL